MRVVAQLAVGHLQFNLFPNRTIVDCNGFLLDVGMSTLGWVRFLLFSSMRKRITDGAYESAPGLEMGEYLRISPNTLVCQGDCIMVTFTS
jgi:hypothetical protein